MTNWMFTINAEEREFERRIKDKQWAIYKRTPSRRSLRENDRIVFYKAGKDGQVFLGTARLTSYARKVNVITYKVGLKNIKIWKKGAHIRKLADKLEIIKNPALWSNYIQGGVRRLSDKDYDLIKSNSR